MSMNLDRLPRANSDSNQPKLRLRSLSTLWLPSVASVMGIASIWSITGGLASCDSTAKFAVPDRKFYAIEAVTAFPAKIDANGHVVGRVCGAPLLDVDGKPPVDSDGNPIVDPAPGDANGMELTANFMSSSLSKPACGEANDKDTSIKEGELINLTRVRTDVPATVSVGNFQFAARCVGSQTDLSPCGATAQPIDASSVVYKNIADRCDPKQDEATRINVALVLDNSGSMKGNIDKEMLKEDADGYYDPAQPPLTAVASDWYGARFNAAKNFIENLNTKDRVVGYVYDESGPKVAASDSFICTGTGDPAYDNAACRPENSGSCPSPGTCDPDPTQTNDSYNVALAEAECLAFGSDISKRYDLENGIDLKQNAASGRASLWKTVDNAFQFLSGGGANCPNGSFGPLGAMHIVVMTDGPDTCVDSDEFSYMSLKDKDTSGKCRTKCATSDVKWQEVLVKMAKLKYPVHVHFVQFQSPGYLEPDPRMIEMACRTDGTYQFINSENFNKSSPGDFSNALNKAITRVRNGLSGTWRIGYKWMSVTSEQEFPKGAIRAVDGDFLFTDSKFASLDPAVHDLDPLSWRFTLNGSEDRRVMMRIPCTSDADCGGTDSCGANHCDQGGICRNVQAPNGEPCGTSGTCRNGACTAGQKCSDAIKP